MQKIGERRSLASLLLWSVILFQIPGMLLMAFRDSPIDIQSLVFSLVLPLATALFVWFVTAFWRVDQVLLTLVLFLCSVSLVILTAITRSPASPMKQAKFIGVGLVCMVFGIVFIRHFKPTPFWRTAMMILSLVFVALPLIIGHEKNGARNWIPLPRMDDSTLQPSEFVKQSLCMVLAMTLSQRQSRPMKLISIGFGAALCAVLLLEKDLGALLLYFLTTVIVYFIATSNGLLSLLGLGAGAAGAVGAYYLFPYVQKRVAIWQNPWSDPTDSGYQVIQSLIAIGSGGLFGMGLGLGMPRSIPLYYCDFVFAAICEQFGMIFALCLLAVYALIVLRGISIAMRAKEGFHALIAFGIVTMLALQTLLIVGGNNHMIPLTGVTLPFISLGGSSMVSCMTGVGILLGISSMERDAS